MKLFQIEEPAGVPVDSDAPGVAVGIHLGTERASVALAVGGNAEILPGGVIEAGAPETVLAKLRERAEKALSRPVTHAVVATELADETLGAAAHGAGLGILRVVTPGAAALLARDALPAEAPVLGAAIQAEDDAAGLPRP